MVIEVFSLCDAANADIGKLNMLGAFDTFWVENVPAMHPHCAIALRVRFDSIEQGSHRVAVNIVDQDGKHLVPPLEGNVDVAFPEGQPTVAVNLILGLQGLKLPSLGRASIDLAMDGRHEQSLPLYVRRREKQQQEPGFVPG
jgi:hypothetical protein